MQHMLQLVITASPHYQEYMYVTTAKTANQQVNTTTSIKATDIPPVNNDTCYLLTSTNVAYGVPTSSNPAYAITIATSTNQAYQVAQGYNTPTYETICEKATDN